MKDLAVVRNIQAHLSNRRVSRRRPGDSLYPLTFPSSDDINFDIWDHLFFVNHHGQSLTVHHFNAPLSSVLDLGCGIGFWAIQAAKQWPTAIVTGYDMLPIQPDLFKLDMHQEVADRIEWVHGNFLDGLPFPSDHFDLVHISKIGLGVPEDEWQSLLEEVARVLKVGGVLEITEEDPIFPCCTILRPDKGSVSTCFHSAAALDSSLLGIPDSSSHQRSDSQSSRHSPPAKRSPQLEKTLPSDLSGSSDNQTDRGETLRTYPRNRGDHTKLKHAWEALLLNRFLPLNLLSVLPFYLSTSFARVQAHLHLAIPLPPNSAPSESRGNDTEQNANSSVQELYLKQLGNSSEQLSALTASASAMHLARRVNVIKSCKDTIRREYMTLFAANKLPNDGTIDQNSILWDAFEVDWQNWLSDMEDRIATRNHVTSQLLWAAPLGDQPEWKTWREELDTELISKPSTGTPICRSIRTFVAWKS